MLSISLQMTPGQPHPIRLRGGLPLPYLNSYCLRKLTTLQPPAEHIPNRMLCHGQAPPSRCLQLLHPYRKLHGGCPWAAIAMIRCLPPKICHRMLPPRATLEPLCGAGGQVRIATRPMAAAWPEIIAMPSTRRSLRLQISATSLWESPPMMPPLPKHTKRP